MHPKFIQIQDYNYPLSDEQIAKYPLSERDASRLLIYREGNITEDIYRSLADHLPADACLVFNNTRVVEARLIFQKPTGANIELFCLEPGEPHHNLFSALQQTAGVRWKCLIGGASKWKKGQVLHKSFDHGNIQLEARFAGKIKDEFLIEFSWLPADMSFSEVLHHAGKVPLPPYLKREAEPGDLERYQTIYAVEEGSVAAPTAGLHFTNHVLERLAERQIQCEYLTLHVGAGTFMPVKSSILGDHRMHEEFIETSSETLRHLLAAKENKKLIAVGTTSMRTLESLYWLGLKLMHDRSGGEEELMLHQWEPYEHGDTNASFQESINALLDWMQRKNLDLLSAKTSLLIAPGYHFRAVDALITNFHQPQSTLLLLVAAFIGEDWKRVYQYALERHFRFLSYGDGCLMFRQPSVPAAEGEFQW